MKFEKFSEDDCSNYFYGFSDNICNNFFSTLTALRYLVTYSMCLCEQMVLALRYLHKEKGILHRDLTPNNIMLGEDDKVTISKSYTDS